MSDGEEQDPESKTEEPTQKRLDDAISKGQVVNSKEVNSFVMFLLISIVLIWILPVLVYKLGGKLRFFIESAGTVEVNAKTIGVLLSSISAKSLLYISPLFFASAIGGIAANYLQRGQFSLSIESLVPKLSKISIIKGFGRLVSMKSLVEFLKGIVKITFVGIFVALLVFSDLQDLGTYQELSIGGIIVQIFNMVKHIFILVTIIMAAIAAVDFSYQSYEHHKQLKMTKQEVKDEHKQSEGNPEIKQKLRHQRRNVIQKQLTVMIPKATVVITNPEHYAVALRYVEGDTDTPICMAKGLDLIAQKIKELAKESDIPIIENPPLARALYKDVEVNGEIPIAHFEEVAKIIYYIANLNKKK